MQGHIAKFRPDLGVGVITTGEGRRYRFSAAQLINPDADLIDAEVDFVPAGRAAAAEIVLLRGNPWTVFAASARA